MKRLPADQLPKGTRLELVILLRRCEQLQEVGVRLPRYSVRALARVIAYLDAKGMR